MFILKKQSIFFLFLLFTVKLFAQKDYNISEYRVSESDVSNDFFAKDSTANALVIYEFGKSYVTQENFHVFTEYKKKVKILNRKGFKYATVKILLYKNTKRSERVTRIFASSYNEVDGRREVMKISKKDIFKEEYNEHYDLVKFTIPNIKEGSVITYSYLLESPFIFNFNNWEFQEKIPKLYSEYQTSIPGNYEYNIKLIGAQKLDVNENEIKKNCIVIGSASASCSITKYVMKDIPAFKEEKYMTTKENYMSKIEYELRTVRGFDGTVNDYTKTWKTVDKELRTSEDIGRELRKTGVLKKIIDFSVEDTLAPLEKAKKIYNYIQDTYTWNEEFRIFNDLSLKRLIKTKVGKISEINILLHNLLRKNGISVKPVLLSTRKNGLVTKIFPVLSEFNYLIVQITIDGKKYLLDATDKYLYFGQIPFRCLNKDGRLLDFKNGSEWIPIADLTTSKTYLQMDLKMVDRSTFEGTLKSYYSGYHALSKKKEADMNPTEYIEKFENKHPNMEVDTHEIKSDGNDVKIFQEEYKLIYEDENSGSDKIYLDPLLIKFFKENPFKLQRRSYPIDFGYKDSYSYVLNLDLGNLYEVVELPKNEKITLPNNKGNYSCFYKVEGTILKLIFTINFKQAEYQSNYYKHLKELMNRAVNAQMKSVVVLKNK